jgi:hypothetical protein
MVLQEECCKCGAMNFGAVSVHIIVDTGSDAHAVNFFAYKCKGHAIPEHVQNRANT